jgi:hypothetical protein
MVMHEPPCQPAPPDVAGLLFGGGGKIAYVRILFLTMVIE